MRAPGRRPAPERVTDGSATARQAAHPTGNGMDGSTAASWPWHAFWGDRGADMPSKADTSPGASEPAL